MKFKDYVDKHWQIMILIAVLAIFGMDVGAKVVAVLYPQATAVSSEVLSAALDETLDKKLDEKLKPLTEDIQVLKKDFIDVKGTQADIILRLDNENQWPVYFLEYELNKFSTEADTLSAIAIWKDKGWGAQIATMRFVAERPELQEQLKSLIWHQEVFIAFMKEARGY